MKKKAVSAALISAFFLFFCIIIVVTAQDDPAQTPAAQTREVPMFEPDPSWPKLPSKYVWGQVSSVSIDDQGHAWILQRPSTVRTDQKGMAAPPVLEFDEAGNFIQGWGGPGAGYLYLHPRHLDGSLKPLDIGWFAKKDKFAYRRPDPPDFAPGAD